MLPLLLIPIALLVTVPAYSQTFCSRIGDSLSCQGDKNVTVAPLGRNGGVITDSRGKMSFYDTDRNGNVMIHETESQSFRDEQRRSEERRREMIYGDDRRGDSRSRYRAEER